METKAARERRFGVHHPRRVNFRCCFLQAVSNPWRDRSQVLGPGWPRRPIPWAATPGAITRISARLPPGWRAVSQIIGLPQHQRALFRPP
jgi:hypothetical protein